MIGSQLKALLNRRGLSVSELARRVGVSAQTLYSIIRRDNMLIDLDLLAAVCRELGVGVEYFCGVAEVPVKAAAQSELVARFNELDDFGADAVNSVLDAELRRVRADRPESRPAPTKIIPLFATPAAAGYANPAFGEDYEDYAVPTDCLADFASRIAGDSMEPWINDGEIVLVQRGASLSDGDVGLFFVDGDLKCKQYCEDILGNIYLFSLNRDRSDADVTIPADSGVTVFCFGRVLLQRRPPLP